MNNEFTGKSIRIRWKNSSEDISEVMPYKKPHEYGYTMEWHIGRIAYVNINYLLENKCDGWWQGV